MKYVLRVLRFGGPLHHYIPEYLVYTVIFIIFGLINFAMLIPMMDALFDVKKNSSILPNPSFEPTISFVIAKINYYIQITALQYGKMTAIIFIGVLLILSNLISGIFKFLSIKTIVRFRIKIVQNIRQETYSKIINQSFQFHNRKRRGELISIIWGEVSQIDSSVVSAIRSWTTDAVIVVTYFLYLFYLSYQLTLVTLIILPVGGFLISRLIKRMRSIGKDQANVSENMFNFLEESLNGIRTIQSYAAASFFNKRFESIGNKFSKIAKKGDLKRELASPVSEFLGITMVVLLLCVGGYFILNDENQMGASAFFSYLIAYAQMISPLKSLTASFSNLQRGIISCERVFEILDQQPKVNNALEPVRKYDFNREIVFDKVSLKYEESSEKYAVKDFNLKIKKGESVALVGASGSGKTSISYLLNRFLDPTQGSISIDGINLKDIDINDVRKLMAYIPQEPLLFYDSIALNVAFGQEVADTNKLKKALRIAYADKFVDKLPQKEQSIVGERGMTLSGGERQRIAIARAIYKEAEIFILDEATSALDSKSEQFVQKAIDQIAKEKTSIIIAHRLSTLKNVDKIIVLDQGKIVEQGSPQKLLAKKNGQYQSLVNMQKIV